MSLQFKNQGDINAAIRKLERFCVYRERCTKEIREKLKSMNIDNPEISDKIIQHLQAEGFLNDERYARIYARSKFKHNHWGRLKITHALRNNDLPDRVIHRAMEEIDPEAYQAYLKEAIIRRLHSCKKNDGFARKAATADYFIRKGFEPDMVWDILNRL